MAPHGKEHSEDLKKRIVAPHENRHGRPTKLSAHAQCHIQRLSLENRHMSAASIDAEVEGVEGQPVLRPYATHRIKLVCMAVVPEGSLF